MSVLVTASLVACLRDPVLNVHHGPRSSPHWIRRLRYRTDSLRTWTTFICIFVDNLRSYAGTSC